MGGQWQHTGDRLLESHSPKSSHFLKVTYVLCLWVGRRGSFRKYMFLTIGNCLSRRKWYVHRKEKLHKIWTRSSLYTRNQALDPDTAGFWALGAAPCVAGINGVCVLREKPQHLPEESCNVVCDLSLILGDDNTDGASVGNNHVCHHLATICGQKQWFWPDTRSRLLASYSVLTKWILLQPTGSQLTICHFLPKIAWICIETLAKSFSPLGVRKKLVNQFFWEILILLRAPGPHTLTGLFSAPIWFWLDLDKAHVSLNHGESKVGFRDSGREILVVWQSLN